MNAAKVNFRKRTNSRNSLTAAKLFEELGKVGSWASEPRKVRWLAARYYSGADSLEVLKSHAEPQPFGDGFFRPVLTAAQVRMIIDLR